MAREQASQAAIDSVSLPADRLEVRRTQRHVEALAQIPDDAILEREDVVHAAVHLHRSHELAGADVGAFGRDADHRPDPLIAAADDPGRAQPAADVDRERLLHACQ